MSKSLIDAPLAVREEDALNIPLVEKYLTETLGKLDGPLEVIGQFGGGASNVTFLIKAGDREMVLRRPPFGTKAASAHDMGREYKVLSALQGHLKYAPKPLAFCEDKSILGEPFYVMERFKGIIIRKTFPKELGFSIDDKKALCDELMSVFQQLHNVDLEASGLINLGKPEGYTARQVHGWNKRYSAAITDDALPATGVMEWLAANIPEDTGRVGLIHNDFKFDNVVLNPDNPREIIGVLDWEMTTIGDPLTDLGATLAYWADHDDYPERKANAVMPSTEPGMPRRRDLVKAYFASQKIEPIDFNFYYVYGLFRLAVISQQIYYRYFHGQTSNEYFARFGAGAAFFVRDAQRAIEDGDLSLEDLNK
jgi:aminoglycoside phosphotransferase (APT) family kinase protein